MSTQKHAKVLIAGGSIAGLTLANILDQLGIDYLLLEKYAKIAPDLGASIGIHPYGLRILNQIGCFDKIEALVEDIDAGQLLTQRNDNGEIVLQFEESGKCISDRYVRAVYVDTLL
jgi:2-polyprenyl-6-methoxyphenol hydroxylase-like FAD-dependent oxidoreductase